MNIVNVFDEVALKYPQYIAIVEGKRHVTYVELQKEAAKTASYFHKKGIAAGDRVMVFVPMSIDLYRILLALFSLGAVAVFVDEWVNKERLRESCKLADVKGFIGIRKSKLLQILIPELRKIPVKLSLKKKDSELWKTCSLEKDHPALITFTTGSVGKPKAALRSHSFMMSQFDVLSEIIKPKPQDVDLTTLPIVLLLNLGAGSTSVIAKYNSRKPKSLKPDSIADQITMHGVTRMSSSPYLLNVLAEYCLPSNTKFPLLKKCFTGGAPVYPTDAVRICQAFPHTEVVVLYGSTEVEPISIVSALELRETNNLENIYGIFAGAPLDELNIKIIEWKDMPLYELGKEEFNKLELPNERVGEIVVSGEHVLKSYFNSDEAFQRNKIVVDKQIWHRTGDSGYMSHGKLYLTGRCSQLLKENNVFVSIFQIEGLLQRVKGVTCGTIVELNNQRVLILEVPDSNVPLGNIALPVEFHRTFILNSIPRDPRHNSKIDYEALKAKMAQEV